MDLKGVLIGDVIASGAVESALDVIGKGLEKANQLSSDKNKRRKKDLLEAPDPDKCFLVVQRRAERKDTYYDFRDQEENIKYVARKRGKREICIVNNAGANAAEIKRKIPLIGGGAESEPQIFEIKISGTKIGRVKAENSLISRKFKSDFNDWCAEESGRGGKYKILAGKSLVASVQKNTVRIMNTSLNMRM